eukprot:7191008-Prymnesium_polylepis.2
MTVAGCKSRGARAYKRVHLPDVTIHGCGRRAWRRAAAAARKDRANWVGHEQTHGHGQTHATPG